MILVVLLHEFTLKFHVKHILYTGFYFLPVLLLTFYAKLFCPGLSLSRHGCFFCYITLKRKKMPSQPTDNWSKKSKNKKVQYFLVYSSYVPQTKFGNILFLLCFLLLWLFFFFYFLLPTFLSASVLIKLLNIWSWNLFSMNRHVVQMCGTDLIFREHACIWVRVMHVN